MSLNSPNLANILLAPYGVQVKERPCCEAWIPDGPDPANDKLCNEKPAQYCHVCEIVVCPSCHRKSGCVGVLEPLRKTVERIDSQYRGTTLALVGGK